MTISPSPEHDRLSSSTREAWRAWGPYVSERAWGTVREDYSSNGDAWGHLPHEAARSVAYRWGEDGLAGLCDVKQRLCLSLAVWNGRDPILKERAFGLTNQEGNHGEDVKERYWYVDATPTASYLQWRYQYPRPEFPYSELLEEGRSRGRLVPEFEVEDTSAFDAGCWDLSLQVAKASPGDLRWELTVTNDSPEDDTLHVLPTMWFRNGWSWNRDVARPRISVESDRTLLAQHDTLGSVRLRWEGDATALFCDNDTNTMRLYGAASTPYPKDGINDHVVSGAETVSPEMEGTKSALWFKLFVPAGESRTVRLQLVEEGAASGTSTPAVLEMRKEEADLFYQRVLDGVSGEDHMISRQSLAGMVWSQCFYHYNVQKWIMGDAHAPTPPLGRSDVRNGAWAHLAAKDIILMPDAWEYPWFAAWDLAFHAIAYAHLDPQVAKEQLLLLTHEWFMHPSGALPAYEWNFDDVNPPVHAWAALEVFHITGGTDLSFLGRMFHRLLLNFTWWVNKQDSSGNSLFEGGFLGMDNIGPFDRSHPAPLNGALEQSDGTAWMAMFCLDMMQIAIHLAQKDAIYEDMALKFFSHFTRIATAMNAELWDETDGFYYDMLRLPGQSGVPLRVRSVAGLVSLAATRVISPEMLVGLPDFSERLAWFLENKDEGKVVGRGKDGKLLLSVVPLDRLGRLLTTVFDEDEFYSPFGLRSLSRRHLLEPFTLSLGEVSLDPVRYEPGESQTGLFGGNSNWRGPVWVPLNHLLVTALRRFSLFTGDDLTFPVPSHGDAELTVAAAGDALADRVADLWRRGKDGLVPAEGRGRWPEGALWFHEYFNGDTGEGLGASHQTGWSSLVADLLVRRNQEDVS